MLIPLILSIITKGAIDYAPECNRPWTVDFRNPKRYPGRGKTLVKALIHYYKR